MTTSSAQAMAIARTFGVCACAAMLLAGCVERRIEVTSTPPGAIVWLNDQEIGRTPCEAAFKFYGVYDVRLALEGYQTLQTSREAGAPFYEYPGPDLIAEVLPLTFEHVERWHFELEPLPEDTLPRDQLIDELRDRAEAFRGQHAEGPGPDSGAEAPAEAPTDATNPG